jgi:hypothetical protein
MRMQFDPNLVQPLQDQGTVYPNIRIVDVWGILTTTKGALISSTYDRVVVSASVPPTTVDGSRVTGDGWTLELNAGWEVVSGSRHGDYTIRKKE